MTPEQHAATIVDRIPVERSTSHRFVIALAGPPGAGKSTVAAALIDALGGRAGLLAMDGFHLDNEILDARGHRPRKGSPHTFDVASYSTTLRALRDEPGLEMAVPVYDRALELSRNCASLVLDTHEILVTEGNYLLLDEQPWSDLRGLFDLTVWIDAPLDVLEQRIVDRWESAFLDATEIHRRTEENDLPNAKRAVSGSVSADLRIANYGAGPTPGEE